jgi:hypothetical protein
VGVGVGRVGDGDGSWKKNTPITYPQPPSSGGTWVGSAHPGKFLNFTFLCTQKVSTLLKSVSVSGRPSVYPITRQKSERLTAIFFAQVCLMNISVEFEDENDRLRNAWAIVKILKSNPAIPEGEYRDFFQKKYFLILRLFELSMKLCYRLSMARNPNLKSDFPSEHPIG